jgi:CheY-like chemotaxis protein
MSDIPLRDILYVDDDPQMQVLVKNVLESTGQMRVTVCQSAMEILEMAIETRPQLILLDYVMPVMDGAAILEEIMNDPRINRTPVIFITSKSTDKDRAKLMSAGAKGVITKPFDIVTLPDQVKKIWKY